jgi:hypothetical protein
LSGWKKHEGFRLDSSHAAILRVIIARDGDVLDVARTAVTARLRRIVSFSI